MTIQCTRIKAGPANNRQYTRWSEQGHIRQRLGRGPRHYWLAFVQLFCVHQCIWMRLGHHQLKSICTRKAASPVRAITERQRTMGRVDGSFVSAITMATRCRPTGLRRSPREIVLCDSRDPLLLDTSSRKLMIFQLKWGIIPSKLHFWLNTKHRA